MINREALEMAEGHPAQSSGAEARLPGSLRSLGLTTVGLLLCMSFVIESTAIAQVGHPPKSSPYRDIRKGHTLTPVGGYFKGDGGAFNIGPHSGAVYGLRYDVRSGSTIQLGLEIERGNLDRFIVDPFVRLANRKTGPVKQSVTFADVALQFNLTGGKSWHRIAPFVGANAGLALAGSTPADTSQFDFGRKFFVAPGAGVRLFLTDRLHLRAEVRATFWKLNYPTTFQNEPREEPGTVQNPNAVIPPPGKLSEWTSSRWLQFGLGYSFSP